MKNNFTKSDYFKMLNSLKRHWFYNGVLAGSLSVVVVRFILDYFSK